MGAPAPRRLAGVRSSTRLLALAVSLAVLAPAAPARADTIVRSPGDPSYVVSLRTGPLGHVWRGTERISFTNLEADPLSRIWLRLWSNGIEGCASRAISVTRFTGGAAGNLSRSCTALPVDLPRSLAQGERATIAMRVSIELPRRNDRFGYQAGLALLGTALPTLAVRDDLGWHLDPFVDLGESFYSVAGSYQVTLDVPTGLSTPTTGYAVSSQTNARRRITTYEARGVRDFEWAAGRLATVRARSGDTQVVVSYRPGDLTRAQATAGLDIAVRSLGTFSKGFGRFPYPEIDVVLTDFTAFGGMEYPTIVFTNRGRVTIAHEVAHQYFYGIVGNDQFDEPWLDESLATWTSYLPFGGWKRCTSFRWPSDTARLTNDMAYWAKHPNEYWAVYSGGGCMLANLADRFGLGRFVEVLRGYAQANWLGISRGDELKGAIEAAAVADGLVFDPTAYWARWRVDRAGEPRARIREEAAPAGVGTGRGTVGDDEGVREPSRQGAAVRRVLAA